MGRPRGLGSRRAEAAGGWSRGAAAAPPPGAKGGACRLGVTVGRGKAGATRDTGFLVPSEEKESSAQKSSDTDGTIDDAKEIMPGVRVWVLTVS